MNASPGMMKNGHFGRQLQNKIESLYLISTATYECHRHTSSEPTNQPTNQPGELMAGQGRQPH